MADTSCSYMIIFNSLREAQNNHLFIYQFYLFIIRVATMSREPTYEKIGRHRFFLEVTDRSLNG